MPCGIIPAVSRNKSPEDLSVEELRRLLLEKRRSERGRRLERFRRTGRVVNLAPDLPSESLDDWQSGDVVEDEAIPVADGMEKSNRRIWTDRLLLMVEIFAVVGLVALLVIGIGR